MVKVRFDGRVLPEHRKFSIDQPMRQEWPADSSFPVALDLRILNGNVSVYCDVPRIDGPFLRHLLSRVYDFARLAIDIYSFATGFGLSVVIEWFINENGNRDPITLSAEELRQHSTVLSVDDHGKVHGFHDVARILSSEQQAGFALNDLISALAHPDLTEINCGRAVDALRKCIAGKGPAKETWPVFNGALNLDRSFTDYISERSADPRHGERCVFPKDMEREQVWRRSWEIMNRFLEYRKRGNNLPVSEFPMLPPRLATAGS